MNPSQKTLQNLRVELARVAEQIRHLQPNTPEWRKLEMLQLELVDELYLQQHLQHETDARRDRLFH